MVYDRPYRAMTWRLSPGPIWVKVLIFFALAYLVGVVRQFLKIRAQRERELRGIDQTPTTRNSKGFLLDCPDRS